MTGKLTGKELAEDRAGLIIKSLVSLSIIISGSCSENCRYVQELRVLYMHK